MSYNHFDIVIEQSPQKPGAPCGDAAAWERSPSGTLLVLADGLGKGVKAHVVAHLFISRLMELFRRGASVREAFRRVATSINVNRLNDGPYAAFGVAWVRSDGESTVLAATMRKGKVVHLLTGPPADREKDHEVVRRFMGAPGTHVLCGGSTAAMTARVLNRRLTMVTDDESWSAPPQYLIGGIDLATEGVVTLTQVCRILNEDPDLFEPSGPVSHLARLLLRADKVELTVGTAANPVNGDISFTQQGIMPRATLVQMLREILEKKGKLVVVRTC